MDEVCGIVWVGLSVHIHVSVDRPGKCTGKFEMWSSNILVYKATLTCFDATVHA
jgi:hypothetical protein